MDEEDASRLIRCLHVLCTTVGTSDLDKPIDRLQIVDDQERGLLLDELNRTAVDIPRGIDAARSFPNAGRSDTKRNRGRLRK